VQTNPPSPDNTFEKTDAKLLKAIKAMPGMAPQALRRLAPEGSKTLLEVSLERLIAAGEVYRSVYGGSTRYYPKTEGRSNMEARKANESAIEREAVERETCARRGVTPARTYTNASINLGRLSLSGFMAAPRAGSDVIVR